METIDPEAVYKLVPGWPSYRVGTDGTIWTIRPKNGKGPLLADWRLSGSTAQRDHLGRAYQLIRLFRVVDGVQEKSVRGVHRIVLEAFVGPCPDGMECAHEDGDPSNNRLENLSWKTPSANQADRIRHGTHNFGERNPRAKLTADQVESIRYEHANGESGRRLARKYGVSKTMIRFIVRGNSWPDFPLATKRVIEAELNRPTEAEQVEDSVAVAMAGDGPDIPF